MPAIPLSFSCITARTFGCLVAYLAVGNAAVRARSIRSDVAVSIVAPDSVRAGETVAVRVRLQNRSGHAVPLALTTRAGARGRPDVRVVVSDARGVRVWAYPPSPTASAPGMREGLFGAGRPTTLMPGQSISWRVVWDQRDETGRVAPPGRYSIVASVPEDAGARLESTPKAIVIR